MRTQLGRSFLLLAALTAGCGPASEIAEGGQEDELGLDGDVYADRFYTSIGGGVRARGIAKAAAHELGHSFGLGHRGSPTSSSTDHMDVWSRGNAWNAGRASDALNCVGGTGKPQDSHALLLRNIGPR